MEDFDYIKAFANVDLLMTEAVAKVIGTVVAKLREGMISSGMTDYAADNLICMAFGTFITTISAMNTMPGAES